MTGFHTFVWLNNAHCRCAPCVLHVFTCQGMPGLVSQQIGIPVGALGRFSQWSHSRGSWGFWSKSHFQTTLLSLRDSTKSVTGYSWKLNVLLCYDATWVACHGADTVWPTKLCVRSRNPSSNGNDMHAIGFKQVSMAQACYVAGVQWFVDWGREQ